MNSRKVWFITGASGGMGLELVKYLLSTGCRVAATSRNRAELEAQITIHREHFLPLEVDITSDQSVKDSIGKVMDAFGKIEVVVNNAGYLLLGGLEELTDREFRQSMDVNLFGAVNVIRATLPFMRAQKSGHIINISSVAGYFGGEKAASYNAPKFALIGITEALAEEVKDFGIKATVAAPGVFRTNFLNSNSLRYAENLIEDYQTRKKIDMWSQFSGSQTGDPQKLVRILADIAEMENPPLHLLLGPDAYQMAKEKRKADDEEFETWKHLTVSTNFDTL